MRSTLIFFTLVLGLSANALASVCYCKPSPNVRNAYVLFHADEDRAYDQYGRAIVVQSNETALTPALQAGGLSSFLGSDTQQMASLRLCNKAAENEPRCPRTDHPFSNGMVGSM